MARALCSIPAVHPQQMYDQMGDASLGPVISLSQIPLHLSRSRGCWRGGEAELAGAPCSPIPETSSLWLRPTHTAHASREFLSPPQLGIILRQKPWATQHSWQLPVLRETLVSSHALTICLGGPFRTQASSLPPFLWSQVQGVGGGTSVAGSSRGPRPT